ncbi:hypothetical protein M409DRAFT_20653 [Zasmidium cellare ATCC 36951]|uniref:Succinate-semialdehyde dehydrogenase, mitochondrial n=1 Tax=Zasmidium cellare ATCC 36951 TaxID=1080233 RepID=A0A6A6CQJ8_ZASCE|nr:uncharacterized protein M409DRAFT_20653 [Zasmidium cellare ATCC 36951]KAF2169434.1 hypothetical protein M409DRAFT_20653 [Zasmidium cellare ATCC 36951]
MAPSATNGLQHQTPDNAPLGALKSLADPSLFIQKAFVGNEWTEKSKSFDVWEPSTATVLGTVADCEVEDFRRAIEVAHGSQSRYFEETTAAQRGAFLRRWYDAIMANLDDLGVILSLENGKTLSEAKGEVSYAASFIAWFAEEATRAYGHTIPSSSPNATLHTVREPVGVCGIITPWNFPAAMITRKVAPALAAGCAVVIKPPSETPYSALALAKLAERAGMYPGIMHVCPTKDRSASSELATNPLVRKISFTGSTGVGKMLANMAAGTLKKVSLELGGNAPFIVFDDANVDLAVEGAMFCKFRCSGQTCVCANRFYVQRGVVGEFTRKLVDAVETLQTGPGLDGRTTQGPLVNEAAVAKVAEHVTDAVEKGAKLEIGGSREKRAGYFFSRDVGRCSRVARKLQVGMVGVNTGKISAAEAPFGGVKESGYGREGSLYGMEDYQVVKSITIGNLDR